MSREIKFRFWYNNRMTYMLENGEVGDCDLSGGDDLSWWLCSDEVIKMQFIRLLDKNGVDVYEQDIIKYLDAFGRSSIKIVDDLQNFFHWTVEHAYEFESCEVVGNVYQNKELLN